VAVVVRRVGIEGGGRTSLRAGGGVCTTGAALGAAGSRSDLGAGVGGDGAVNAAAGAAPAGGDGAGGSGERRRPPAAAGSSAQRTTRRTPASAAASSAFSVPPTLTARSRSAAPASRVCSTAPARWKTPSAPAKAAARDDRSSTSPVTRSSRSRSARRRAGGGWRTTSRTRASLADSRRSVTWLPRKPVPPVTAYSGGRPEVDAAAADADAAIAAAFAKPTAGAPLVLLAVPAALPAGCTRRARLLLQLRVWTLQLLAARLFADSIPAAQHGTAGAEASVSCCC